MATSDHPSDYIPLMHVLNGLNNAQRQIIIDHLDDDACKSIHYCIELVLSNRKKLKKSQEKQVLNCLQEFNKDIVKVVKNTFKKKHKNRTSLTRDRRELARIGGSPIGLFLSTAIPLLLDLVI